MAPSLNNFTVVVCDFRGRPVDVDAAWFTAYTNILWFRQFLFPALLAVTIVGSLALLVVLAVQRRRTKMPATVNLALCALLAADLLQMVMEVMRIFDKALPAPYAQVTSVGWDIAKVLSGYFQSLVSLDRLLAVAMPLRVKLLVTRPRVIVALVAITVLTIAGAVNVELSEPEESTSFMVLRFVVYFGVPLLVLSACTCAIVACLVRRRAEVGVVGRLSPDEVRLALILVVIDVVYLLSMLPYCVVCGLQMRDKGAFFIGWYAVNFLDQLAYLATSLGAATDWVVLLCMGRRVREASVAMLTCEDARHRRRRSSDRTAVTWPRCRCGQLGAVEEAGPCSAGPSDGVEQRCEEKRSLTLDISPYADV